MKKSVLVVIFVLGSIGASHAQGGIVRQDNNYGSHVILPTNTASFKDLIGTGGGFFFGGFGDGEVPVRDATTRSQTTITAIKTAAMLVDMLIQALTGGGPSNESTGALIQEQAEYGQDGSILYGHYQPSTWMDAYKEDIEFLHGDWMEEYSRRQHIRLTTQMDLMQLLKMRQDKFAEDSARIDEIKRSIDGCPGRLCAIQASGAAAAESAMQSLQEQQLMMTIANAQAAAVGGEVNEARQSAKQQEVFLTNKGQYRSQPQLVDVGLR